MKRTFSLDLIVFILIITGIDAYSFYKLYMASAADDAEVQALYITNAVRDVFRMVTGAETSQRGYLINGREEYLDLYDDALKNLDSTLKKLSDLIGSNNSDMISLNRLCKEKMEELTETIKLRRYRSQEEAVRVVNTDRGRKLMHEIRAIALSICDVQQKRVDLQSKILKECLEWLKYLRAAHTLIAVVIGGALLNKYIQEGKNGPDYQKRTTA